MSRHIVGIILSYAIKFFLKIYLTAFPMNKIKCLSLQKLISCTWNL